MTKGSDIEIKIVVNDWTSLRKNGIAGTATLIDILNSTINKALISISKETTVSYDIGLQSDDELRAIIVGNVILEIIEDRIKDHVGSIHSRIH